MHILVDTVETVDTADTVETVDTADTVETIDTADTVDSRHSKPVEQIVLILRSFTAAAARDQGQ